MMNTNKQSQHKRFDRHGLLIATVLILAASLVVLGNIPLSGILLMIGIFLLLLSAARIAGRFYAHYWRQRNQEAGFKNVTDGTYERLLRGFQTETNDMKTEYSALKRTLGNVHDDGERARLFMELTGAERKVSDFQDKLSEEFKSLRELRQSIKQITATRQDLMIERDRLLRQTSFVYNARKSLEELVVVKQKIEDDANQVVSPSH